MVGPTPSSCGLVFVLKYHTTRREDVMHIEERIFGSALNDEEHVCNYPDATQQETKSKQEASDKRGLLL